MTAQQTISSYHRALIRANWRWRAYTGRCKTTLAERVTMALHYGFVG